MLNCLAQPASDRRAAKQHLVAGGLTPLVTGAPNASLGYNLRRMPWARVKLAALTPLTEGT